MGSVGELMQFIGKSVMAAIEEGEVLKTRLRDVLQKSIESITRNLEDQVKYHTKLDSVFLRKLFFIVDSSSIPKNNARTLVNPTKSIFEAGVKIGH